VSDISGGGGVLIIHPLSSESFTVQQITIFIEIKGKVYPKTGHDRSEGNRRSSTVALTLTLDGGW
jgi:hypothetical protein